VVDCRCLTWLIARSEVRKSNSSSSLAIGCRSLRGLRKATWGKWGATRCPRCGRKEIVSCRVDTSAYNKVMGQFGKLNIGVPEPKGEEQLDLQMVKSTMRVEIPRGLFLLLS